jgi:hypothetical protein
MRILSKIALTLVSVSCLSAQEARVPVDGTSATGRRVMGERDKGKEDEVATLFEKTRSGLKIPHLGRIEYRDILQEQICTVAFTGIPPSIHRDSATFAIYKTARPDVLSPELHRVASFEILHPKNKAGYRRYSVAVWRTKEPQTQETTYWVGVNLYWSAPVEFFDYHFTDGIYDRKISEKDVVPQCRAK